MIPTLPFVCLCVCLILCSFVFGQEVMMIQQNQGFNFKWVGYFPWFCLYVLTFVTFYPWVFLTWLSPLVLFHLVLSHLVTTSGFISSGYHFWFYLTWLSLLVLSHLVNTSGFISIGYHFLFYLTWLSHLVLSHLISILVLSLVVTTDSWLEKIIATIIIIDLVQHKIL